MDHIESRDEGTNKDAELLKELAALHSKIDHQNAEIYAILRRILARFEARELSR